MHMMSAGRVQLYERVAGPRDRTSRLLVRVLTPAGESLELRLREFGKRQAAWVKLLTDEALEEAEAIAGLGPEAWPDPPICGRCSLRRGHFTAFCATGA